MIWESAYWKAELLRRAHRIRRRRKTYTGLDEDLYITADAEAFVKWHAGQLSWAQATREGLIQLDGLPPLVIAFPTWNARSMFAHIGPVSGVPASPAG